ncbi:MAG TPA: outer membrane lipoprotein-sorting protein [Terriglobia bacterium]|nr:outer membrane lipoprotein-sorting protein [Terriglobia bacterium]
MTVYKLFGKLKCIVLRKDYPAFIFKSLVSMAIASAIVAGPGCAVRRTTKVAVPEPPAPEVEASLDDLVARVNKLDGGIQSVNATVDFEPTAGSVYSGVIKEYHDVKGFILVKRPALIRVIGQAPVIRTNIFDMVSDGKTFKLNIPPKHKFIVGSATLTRPSKNALENMRPQHILDALLMTSINPANETVSYEEAEQNSRRYYVLTVLQQGEGKELFPQRKVWLDRSNLEIAQLQLYGPKGSYIEDVHYSDYKDFQGTHYPERIEISRPIEDYRLAITIQKATFNQELTPGQFELKQPNGSQLVEMSEAARPEVDNGK